MEMGQVSLLSGEEKPLHIQVFFGNFDRARAGEWDFPCIYRSKTYIMQEEESVCILCAERG